MTGVKPESESLGNDVVYSLVEELSSGGVSNPNRRLPDILTMNPDALLKHMEQTNGFDFKKLKAEGQLALIFQKASH